MARIRDFFNVSNLITASRLFCLAPFIYFYERGDHWEAIFFLVIGMVTDVLDGYLARRLDQVSELGKILDPLIDKICLGVVAYYLWTKEVVPLWPFVLLVVRDIMILLGGRYLMKKKNVVPMSLSLGKWSVTVVAIGLVVSIVRLGWMPELAMLLLYLGGALLVVSFLQYAARFFHLLKTATYAS